MAIGNSDAAQDADIYRTRFYSDCSGVFEGGGCRAAAYAGAYSAAYGHGVRFSETAGTSAGAIVAALIAAGAEPEFLLRELRLLDFREFLKVPLRPVFSGPSATIRTLISCFLGEELAAGIIGALKGGRYSSEGIGEWMEHRLSTLIPGARNPVQFGDLPRPLYVVASDLTTMKARVWSTRDTPTASVAHAVRASCSIPFFFQPLEEGSTLLVDGGLVSNLPLFVFATGSSTDQFPDRRTLSFALEADQSTERPRNAANYLRKLVSLAIDGGSDAQSRFRPHAARISIPTGTIQATDFDRMDKSTIETLIESGARATTSFIKQELRGASGGSSRANSLFDQHQAYLRLTEQSTAARNFVLVSFLDTKWFWELFPTVYYWLRNGISIHCFTAPSNEASADSAKEDQRRLLMARMGIQLYEQPHVPFRGFIIDEAGPSISALLFAENHFDYEPVAQFYEARGNVTVLSALLDKVKPHLRPAISPQTLKMVAAQPGTVIDLLKANVRQYRNPSVRIQLEAVQVNKIQLISKYVRAFRYRQIGGFIDAYKHDDLDIFQPAEIRLSDGTSSIVTPPVFEVIGDEFVALEGNTRSLYCFHNSIETINAIVVRGANEALPGIPVPLKQVRITSSQFRPDERIQGFNRDLFRDIERAVRPIARRADATERAR